jgi:hypothetical protein
LYSQGRDLSNEPGLDPLRPREPEIAFTFMLYPLPSVHGSQTDSIEPSMPKKVHLSRLDVRIFRGPYLRLWKSHGLEPGLVRKVSAGAVGRRNPRNDSSFPGGDSAAHRSNGLPGITPERKVARPPARARSKGPTRTFPTIPSTSLSDPASPNCGLRKERLSPKTFPG